LRAEQHREGSEYGALIQQNIKEGKIVPSEVTVKLLHNAITSELEKHKDKTEHGWGDGKGRFLVDGFPRQMDQALIFDETVRDVHITLSMQSYLSSGLPIEICPLLRDNAGGDA
jgi:UMP-CMP kinase